MNISTSLSDSSSANRMLNLNLHTRNRIGSGIVNRADRADSYESSVKTAAAGSASTYRPTAKTAGQTSHVVKPAMDYSSREGRDEIGEYYNIVLADLRKQYDEPEAMRRFDEFMRSEGYMSVHSEEYRAEYENNSIYTLNGPIASGTSGAATGAISWSLWSGTAELPDLNSSSEASYQLRSEVKTAYINGQVEYLAESYGTMHSDRAWTDAMREAWQSQSEEVSGVDAQAYLDKVPDGERRAVVGADAGVGDALTAALAEAGITLGEDESIVMSFPIDQRTGNYMGQIRTGRDDIDAVINGNATLRNALNALRDSVPGRDTSAVPGEYQDGTRRVSYSQERQLVFSPSQSDSVVATDKLNVTASGYTYVKQVSDEFDPSCDSYRISAGENGRVKMMDGTDSGGRVSDEFVEDLNRAIAEGGTVKSTITRDEYNEHAADVDARFTEYMYEMTLKMKYLITADGPVEYTPEMPVIPPTTLPPRNSSVVPEEDTKTESADKKSSGLSEAVTTLRQKYSELLRSLRS